MSRHRSCPVTSRCFRWVAFAKFCIIALMVLALSGCGGGSSDPAPDTTSGSEESPNPLMPSEETPDITQPSGSSQFAGKLSFSSVLGWPVNLFDFGTDSVELSLQTDPMIESLVRADLSPDANYMAYMRVFTDGLITGKTQQILLRDLTLEQEYALPFDNGDSTQLLNSAAPSVSSTGIVVFERYTEIINSAGLPDPDDRTAEGISYWNGSGQPVALAASVSEPSKPRITEDGNSVFFIANSDGKRALWKTSLAADAPVTVWAPSGAESLVANSLPIYDVSNDGNTVAYGVLNDGRMEVHYVTPSLTGVFALNEPGTSIQSFGLSGDGSTLMVTSVSTSDDTSSVATASPRRLHVVNLTDGSSVVAEDSALPGSEYFPLTAIPAVSFDGKALAMVNKEPRPGDLETLNLFSLFVFKPGEFDKAQRIIRDADYGGLTSVTLSLRFRGGVI